MDFGTLIRTVFVLSTTFTSFLAVQGIDLQRAKQNENMRCFVPKYRANINATWFTSQNRWYYPKMSVLDLYSEALEASGKSDASNIREDELYYDACLTYDVTSGSGGQVLQGVVTAFGGIQTPFQFDSTDGFRTINWRGPSGSTYAGTSYVTLTDNETFIFMITCREGRMTWAVNSRIQPISANTSAIIERHALSLGFQKPNFTGLRYDTCPESTRQQRQGNIGNRKPPQQQNGQWGRGLGFGWSL